MSVTILVRKHTAAPRFKPHYNSALGRYCGTRQEYVKAMKDAGCEPYRPSEVRTRSTAPYVPSRWCREMISAGIGKNGKVGDVWKNELLAKSKFAKPPEGLNPQQGGFNGEAKAS